MAQPRSSRTALRSGLVALALLFAMAAQADAATVSGTVYNDYDDNGVLDVAPSAGAVDTGIAGVTVRAYAADNSVLASTTTGVAGAYSFDPGNRAVRVEVAIPSGLDPSQNRSSTTTPGTGANTTSLLRSDERYVDATAARSGIDFGLQIPGEYSVDNPRVYFSQFWIGSPLDATAAAKPGLRQLDFFNGAGNSATLQSADTAAGISPTVATYGQIGTTWGVGVDQGSGDVYAGAYYKRITGLVPAGTAPYGAALTSSTGAIYRIVPSTGAVTLFADVNGGSDDHPAPAAALTNWLHDPSWNDVGKRAWGSVRVDPANANVYAVNLFDKKLYRFPLGGAAPVAPASATAIPDPGCDSADWRPYSIGFRPSDDAMFVGGVCSAETSQAPANLHAYVYRVGTPAATPSFGTPVFNFPLDYNRLDNNSAHYPNGSGTTATAVSNWEPWPTQASVGGGANVPPTPRGSRATAYGNVTKAAESYPELSGMRFDAAGNMLLSLKDLMGDMSGNAIPGETSNPITQGDLLKACTNSSGGWDLESAGVCGGQTGFVTDSVHLPGADIFGPIGPSGRTPTSGSGVPTTPGPSGYFFDPEVGFNEISGPGGHGTIIEPAPDQGAVLQIPGFRDLVSTQTDAQPAASGGTLFSVGLVWDSNADGSFQRGVRDSDTPGSTSTFGGAFGKSNGVGDLEAFTKIAPVQIGNRVWDDRNASCTNDAGEPGLAGVTIDLTTPAGTIVATTTTDSSGEYAFDVQSGTGYKVAISTSQGPLGGRVPTCSNKPATDARITSKGVASAAQDTAAVPSHAAGQNDYTYDFGFVATARLCGVVYHDRDLSRTDTGGDQPLASVTVTLTGTDARGNPVTATAATSASGAYCFTALLPGTYRVRDSNPAGYVAEVANPGTPGGGSTPDSDTIDAITLRAGDDSQANDFGKVVLSKLCGVVYHDNDGDKRFGAGDAGIAGVTVTLTTRASADALIVKTTTSDAQGNYCFSGLAPGTYAVHDVNPAGYLAEVANPGTPGGGSTPDPDTIQTIKLGQGTASLHNDLGKVSACLHVTERPSVKLVRQGGSFVWIITTSNCSKVAITAVKVCATLAGHVTVVKTGGGKLAGGKVCWRLGTIRPGDHVSRRLTVRVDTDTKKGTKIRSPVAARASHIPERPANARVKVIARRGGQSSHEGVTG